MLSTATSLAPAPLLDLHQDNWSTWNQSLKLLCFTKFGVAGNQILTDRFIPLHPFANEPTNNDLDLDPAGTPIPGEYIYQPCTPPEGEPAGNALHLPLSTQGNTYYRDDKKIFNDVKRHFSDQDTDCLDHLYRHISLASHIAIKTHTNYPAYQLLAIGARSHAFHIMIWGIHSIGNAATKLHRTRNYMNITQSDLPHEETFNSMTETFKLDFKSTAHPGFVSVPELTSFLNLAGLNRTEFRRALDDLLQDHPTGRFPDSTALMSQLQAWKIANSLSFTRDDVSTQGSALLASQPITNRTKSQAAKTAGNIPNAPKPHLHPTPCT